MDDDRYVKIQGAEDYFFTASGGIYRLYGNRYREIKCNISKGYEYCWIKWPKGWRRHRKNVILCSCFHGPKPAPKMVARHLNGNKLDNRKLNLAWGTHWDNYQDSIRHGTNSTEIIRSGEDSYNSKLSLNDVNDIRSLLSFRVNGADIARKFGVSKALVSLIKNNKIWRK